MKICILIYLIFNIYKNKIHCNKDLVHPNQHLLVQSQQYEHYKNMKYVQS